MTFLSLWKERENGMLWSDKEALLKFAFPKWIANFVSKTYTKGKNHERRYLLCSH